MEITYTVTTDINGKKLTEKISKRFDNVQGKLDKQVMEDSNYYCPMYTGVLRKSSIISTVLGSGHIVWNTPYAHLQYYNFDKKYKLKNPNAQMKWFEVAKAVKIKEWVKLVNDEYRKQN